MDGDFLDIFNSKYRPNTNGIIGTINIPYDEASSNNEGELYLNINSGNNNNILRQCYQTSTDEFEWVQVITGLSWFSFETVIDTENNIKNRYIIYNNINESVNIIKINYMMEQYEGYQGFYC